MGLLTPGEVIHSPAYDYYIREEYYIPGVYITLLKVHNDRDRDPGLRVFLSEKNIMEDESNEPEFLIGSLQYKGTTLYVLSCDGMNEPSIKEDATQCSFPSGAYKGDLKNGIPHGRGRMHWKNHNIYKGEWKEGHADGFGILRQPNGLRYEGYWKNDLQDGYGLCFYPNGDIYQGNFCQGVRQGHGILRQPGGEWYEGAFENDQLVRNDIPATSTICIPSTEQPSCKPSIGYRIWCKTWRLLAALACFGLGVLLATWVMDFFSGHGPSRMSVKGIIAPFMDFVLGIKLLISFFTHLFEHTDD